MKRTMGARVAILAAALVIFTAVPTGSSAWRGPIRLPWYGTPYFGNPTACGEVYTRWKRSVAVRPGTGWRCGDRVELRQGKRTVVARVTDTFSPAAPSWVVFDASARIGCALLNPRNLQPPAGKALGTCYTRDGVYWRLVRKGSGREL